MFLHFFIGVCKTYWQFCLCFSYQDSHSQGWCTNTSCWSWVGFRLDIVCVLFMISVAAGAFYAKLDVGKFEFKSPRKALLCIVYLPIKMFNATLDCPQSCRLKYEKSCSISASFRATTRVCSRQHCVIAWHNYQLCHFLPCGYPVSTQIDKYENLFIFFRSPPRVKHQTPYLIKLSSTFSLCN